ncbi:T6SS immunity protein Tdi1 domain-containing protein [Undibacterium sp. Ren11W]|uniref:T6SS immunity protein Tdi1 domain-containing protein n=1 Tax=Undibacterium sp. Ren11W TaxID=3413045 RepID=UPI003BF38B56
MSDIELFAPINDLAHGDALEDWRWLVGSKAQALLLTAMGDLFVTKPNFLGQQPIFLLDPNVGAFTKVTSNRAALKARIAAPDIEVSSWLKYELLQELHRQLGALAPGNCYSPRVPASLGGSYEHDNFEQADWRVHLSVLGQVHQQIKDLPPGTSISKIELSK